MAKRTPDLPHLPWLRSFEAAARRLNLTQAGQELGLTQAAVSQHVTALEGRLGVKLFIRRQRGVELTIDGAAYLPHVQTAFGALARNTEELFGRGRETVLSIVAPISFTSLWLAPRVADFRQSNPGILLSITTAHLPADYALGETDFEIRFGAGNWPGRQAWRLTSERLTPVCAPSLVSRRGARDVPSWTRLPLLSVKGPREMWRDWFALAKVEPVRPACQFDSFIAAFEAARHGAGVLLGSRPLIDRTVKDGELSRLSKIELTSPSGHFLTARSDLRLSPQHQRMLEWFIAQG